jgi:hypothetical protein
MRDTRFWAALSPAAWRGEALRFIAQFKTWGVCCGEAGAWPGNIWWPGRGRSHLGNNAASPWRDDHGLSHDDAQGPGSRGESALPHRPQDLRGALIPGGGFGIFGDYMFGKLNRFGGTSVEALAGPTAGTVGDVLQMISTPRGVTTRDPTARPQDLGPNALRLAKNNTPFINLFYTCRLLDYPLLHSAQESMNPGYLARAQRSLQRNTGQIYFLSPQTPQAIWEVTEAASRQTSRQLD